MVHRCIPVDVAAASAVGRRPPRRARRSRGLEPRDGESRSRIRCDGGRAELRRAVSTRRLLSNPARQAVGAQLVPLYLAAAIRRDASATSPGRPGLPRACAPRAGVREGRKDPWMRLPERRPPSGYSVARVRQMLMGRVRPQWQLRRMRLDAVHVARRSKRSVPLLQLDRNSTDNRKEAQRRLTISIR